MESQLDIAFVIDTTGSMQPYIQQVQTRLSQIITEISTLVSCSDIRCALIGYKDHCDSETVKVHRKFSSDLKFLQTSLTSITAQGGGDHPEAVTDGLYQVARLDWRSSAVKTCILIGDAPPHGCGEKADWYPDGCPCGEEWTEQIQVCKEKGIIIHTVNCSPKKIPAWEYIAKETYGQYIQLGSEVNKLSSVVTGVVQVDFDKFRLATEVDNIVKQHKDEIWRYLLEKQRVNWITNKLVNLQVKELNPQQKIISRLLFHNDIRHAISILAKHSQNKLIPQLFPEASNTALKIEGGLFSSVVDKEGNKAPVPLKSVEVKVSVKYGCATVEISQTYVNTTEKAATENSLECSYQFPVEDNAAVCGFTAEIEDRKIIAKCMEAEKAQNTYDDSIASGHGAFLLEQKRTDVFSVSVGNLLPNQQVIIRIKYVTLIEQNESGIFRFVLPTTVAPKYSPPIQDTEPKNSNDGPSTSFALPYKMNFHMDIEMASSLSNVTSPTHNILVESTDNKASVTLNDIDLNCDLVVLFKQTEDPKFQCYVETIQSSNLPQRALMLSFKPSFTKEQPASNRELVLVIDCSDSMDDSQIENAKKAALYFVESLKSHQDVKFNIVSFGSDANSLFKNNEILSKQTEVAAQNFILGLQPTKGGTQLRKALAKVKQISGTSETVDVIVITDGQLADDQRIAETVLQRTKEGYRFFTIGVGYAINYNIIRMIARIGQGASEFSIPEETESMEAKLDRHLTRIFYSADSVTTDWGALVEGFPFRLNSVINNTRLVFFAFLENAVDSNKPIHLKISSAQFTYNISISLSELTASLSDQEQYPIQNIAESNTIHLLAGREFIREYEESKLASRQCYIPVQRVVSLATSLCLASSLTSFVAVDERESQATTMQKIDVLISSPIRKPASQNRIQPRQETNVINLVGIQPSRSGGGCCGDDCRKGPYIPLDPQTPMVRTYLRIAMVGEVGVGKRAVGHRFAYGTFGAEVQPIGYDFVTKHVMIAGKSFPVQCWMLGATKHFALNVPFYIRRCDVAILMFDLGVKETFEKAVSYWLTEVLCDYEIKVYLVGNKLDQHTPTEQEREEYRSVAQKYDMTFMECSAKDGTGVEDIFNVITSEYFSVSEVDNQNV